MQHRMQELGRWCGLIAPLWAATVIGAIAATDPSYSHVNDPINALGAVGAPTQGLLSTIAFFPLGGLFIAFGFSARARFGDSLAARSSALLIILHGVACIVCGLFSCDVICTPENPSGDQILHNYAGLAMYLSLQVAMLIWARLARRLDSVGEGFAWFSAACALVAIATVPLMAHAMDSGTGFGLFQRVNYAAALVWIAGLAIIMRQVPPLRRVMLARA